MYPQELLYTKEHEWIRVHESAGTIGITDHAQEQLGDVVYVELPKTGDEFAANDSFGSVEPVKAVSEVFTPVSGKVAEVTQTLGDTQREAKFGGSAALSFRIAPNVLLGGEVWYLRHYNAANLTALTGDTVLLGPTLFIQLTPKSFIQAAWNTQVWGREVANPGAPFNFEEFQRNRAKLKFAYEF